LGLGDDSAGNRYREASAGIGHRKRGATVTVLPWYTH
jgi:hypothetical protein